jgi:hypothetical protein
MDKTKPLVTKLQESFIKNLVGTLFKSYNDSGLVPAVLVEDELDSDQQGKRLVNVF